MPSTELPAGRYLSCTWRVTTDAAGQTRAMLHRNRMLVAHGVRPDILTLGAAPDYAQRRAVLREQGLLPEGVGLLNIYDHFREHGWGDATGTGEELPDLTHQKIDEELRADGSPWRITYRAPGSGRPLRDYLREDGSPYLRIPAAGVQTKPRRHGPVIAVGPDGQIVRTWRQAGGWFRRWIRDVVGGERAFAFVDSRFVVPHIVPFARGRIHVIYQLHNIHTRPPYRWDSPMMPPYRRLLARIGDVDAFVTLTERQREDLAERFGDRSNLFVIPNAVAPPSPPAEPPLRDPHRVTMLARLEPQKRIEHAIAAFEQVVAAVPAARLDVFGEGSARPALEAEIERRGLAGSVVLRGFDPRAVDALWASSAMLLTSRFEGYPLSTLKSLSRACPVVGYDIKYGPREQVQDGVSGFLVAPGDVDALAARVVELLRSPDLVRRFGDAGRAWAAEQGEDGVMAGWAGIVRGAARVRRRRTEIDDVQVDLQRFRIAAPLPLLRRGGPAGRLQLDGRLTVRGQSRRATLDTAQVTLSAVDDATGEVTIVPLSVKLEDGRHRVRARARLARVDGTRLRLRVAWENAAWETSLSLPPAP